MSAHHTYTKSSEIIECQEKIERLKSGNTPELMRAEQNLARSLEQQKESYARIKKSLSKERQKNLQRVHEAVNAFVEESAIANNNAEIVQKNMQELNAQVLASATQIDQIVRQIMSRTTSAEHLYMEMAAEVLRTETLVQYQRFASEKQMSIQERLAKLSAKEMAPSAMQIMTTSVLTDIYLMDLEVAREQAEFDNDWAEAKRILETTIAQLKSAKSENYAEIGNPETELLDIDYWTNGEFSVLLSNLESLNQTLSVGYNNSSYSKETLMADLKRIKELELAKETLIKYARQEYNQSLMRENQALAAMDILIEDHQFSLVGKGFEGNDRREAYIIRMCRHTDNAEIEIIVSPTVKVGEYNLYFRLDTKTYSDESVVRSITEALANDFKEAGLKIDVNPHCCAERLEPFNIARPTISDAARHLHNIPEPQQHTQI